MIFPPEIIPVTLAVFAAAASSALLLLQRAQFGAALSDMRKSLDQTQAQQHFLEALMRADPNAWRCSMRPRWRRDAMAVPGSC